jgi:hypothetical protein
VRSSTLPFFCPFRITALFRNADAIKQTDLGVEVSGRHVGVDRQPEPLAEQRSDLPKAIRIVC